MIPASTRTRRGESVLLAAIHTFSLCRAPRLDRVLPPGGVEGEPVLLIGSGFLGGALLAHFGEVAVSAVTLSDSEAVAIVPTVASAGPLTVSRFGLRSNPVAFGGSDDDGPRLVRRVDPGDGATGVFRDAPVVLRLTHPVSGAAVESGAVEVLDDCGSLPGASFCSPDGLVLVWRSARPLRAGILHFVSVCQLVDRDGHPFQPHLSRFLPCSLTREDLSL